MNRTSVIGAVELRISFGFRGLDVEIWNWRSSRGDEAQISSEAGGKLEPPHVGCYFPKCWLRLRPTHEIARWPIVRDEFPLPAERGEGQGEGCLGDTRSLSGNVFKAFPSPRPSPRSFLAGRGRR